MNASASAVALVGLIIACGSCTPLSSAARDTFAKQASCPPERVTVTRRRDLAGHDLYRDSLYAPPPADVAADPARLRYFRQQQANDAASLDEECTVYEATGCGQHTLFCCEHPFDGTELATATEAKCT